MSQFDVKMTELADAIKVKNTNASGKLSVQGMIDAVSGIVINPPSGGGVDVSGVTANASDVLNTVKFVDNTGTLKSGTIATITPTVSGDVLTVPVGYNPTEQTFQISGGGIDTSDATATASQILDGATAYVNGVKITGNIKTVAATLADNVVTVPAGHIAQSQTLTVPEMNISNDGKKITIPVGYNKTVKTYSLGSDVSGVTVPQNKVPEGYYFVNKQGQLLEGTLRYSSDWSEDAYINTVQQAKDGLTVAQNILYENGISVYVKNAQNIKPENLRKNVTVLDVTGTMEEGADVSGVTATANDVLQGYKFVDSNGELKDGAIPVVEPNNMVGFMDYVITTSAEAMGGKLVAENILYREGAWVGVAGAYAIQPENIRDGVQILDVVGTYKGEGTGDSSVKFGYWTADGKFQEVDLSGSSPVDTGSPITVDAVTFDTGKPVPEYGGGGGDGSTATSIEFYKCTSYDDGETIPAYTNIVISGITSPEAVNGTYILQEKHAEGTDRKWVNDNGYTIECKNSTWYIYDGMSSPNVMTSLYYSEVLPSTTGDGTDQNPVYWDSVVGTDRTITPDFSTADYSGNSFKRNFYVKLNAGTEYLIGVSNSGFDADILLFDLDGNLLKQGDEDNEEINGVNYNDSVRFTPSSTGIYRIAAGAYSSGSGTSHVACYPAPEYAEAPTATEPWEITWKLGGAKEGAYIITAAGYAGAIGEYEISGEKYNEYDVWVNTTTGAVWKVAATSGSNVRWYMYENSTSSWGIYYARGYYDTPTPWDLNADDLTYSNQSTLPLPTLARGKGQAEGVLQVGTVNIAERPATGVKEWSGYKATQNSETGKWTISDIETTGLLVKGNIPIVSRIYSADTTIQVLSFTEEEPGKMICLAHWDTGNVAVDGTGTCIVYSHGNQNYFTTDKAKFGRGSWFMNNFTPSRPNTGFALIGLPEVSGDFTIDFWHWYEGYTAFGGRILSLTDSEYNVTAQIDAIRLSEGHPQYLKKEWFHHAFVRHGSTVYEYINGVKVNESEFTATLGGDNQLTIISSGGWSYGDIRNYIDEFAIFDYAKYTKNFTPPFMQYDDEPSGLRTPDTTVSEVTVSGITGIRFANSSSYYLTNPDYNTNYPTSRVWSTTDGKWFITFDDYEGGWVVANSLYWDDNNRITAAYIKMDMEAQYYIDPIGHSGWVDAITKKKIKVVAN